MNERATTINFPPDRKKALKVEAANRGMTMERLIVEAFDAYISGNENVKNENRVVPNEIQRYDLVRIVRAAKKSIEIAAKLGELTEELKAAAIHTEPGGISESEFDKFMRNASPEAEDIFRKFTGNAEAVQGNEGPAREIELPRDRKLPGGAA